MLWLVIFHPNNASYLGTMSYPFFINQKQNLNAKILCYIYMEYNHSGFHGLVPLFKQTLKLKLFAHKEQPTIKEGHLPVLRMSKRVEGPGLELGWGG